VVPEAGSGLQLVRSCFDECGRFLFFISRFIGRGASMADVVSCKGPVSGDRGARKGSRCQVNNR
jgi:hypothetical protein